MAKHNGVANEVQEFFNCNPQMKAFFNVQGVFEDVKGEAGGSS